MKGAERKAVKSLGKTYTIRNAAGTSGGRDSPSYSDDGELTAVIDQRSRPRSVTDSSGSEIESDLELRAVYDTATTTIRGVGASDLPTELVHPNGTTYRVLDVHDEDKGVTVLTVATT